MNTAIEVERRHAAERDRMDDRTTTPRAIALGLVLSSLAALPISAAETNERVTANQIVVVSDDIRNTATEVVHNTTSASFDVSDESSAGDEESSGASESGSDGEDADSETTASDAKADAKARAKAKKEADAKARADAKAKKEAEAKAKAEAQAEAKAAAKAKAEAFAKARARSAKK